MVCIVICVLGFWWIDRCCLEWVHVDVVAALIVLLLLLGKVVLDWYTRLFRFWVYGPCS